MEDGGRHHACYTGRGLGGGGDKDAAVHDPDEEIRDGFESIRDSVTSLATMNRLIMAANDGSLDDSTPQDIKDVAGLEDVDSAVDPKTPCKGVRLVNIEDDSPADDGSSPTTTRWRTAEQEFSSVANRLLTVEGAIGVLEPD